MWQTHDKDGSYDESPNNDDSNNIDSMSLTGKSLTKCSDNDDHQFYAV